MVIEVNKNIDNYKESVVLGLTARQLIFSIISLIVGGGIVLLTYPYVGLTTSAYIAIPVVAPIALTGFYSYNGMTFVEMMKLKLHFAFGNRTLTYISTEGQGHPHRASPNVRQLCIAHRGEHSKKPDEIRDRIVELCGNLPRIELFARKKSEGWECLGNEIDGKDIREALKALLEEDSR
jgi:hypothetical protein